MQAYKRQAYLCSLLKFIHDRNYNIFIIRLPGKVLHVLTFGMVKIFQIKMRGILKHFIFKKINF